MNILIDNNNVLIAKGGIFQVSNGFKLNDVVYGSHLNLKLIKDIEVPENVEIKKYCYSEENGFYLNPDYSEPINHEAEIISLKQTIQGLQSAMAELTLMMATPQS